MFYKVDFRCDDRDELQRLLNERYQYADNEPAGKIAHRNRLNLFYVVMSELIDKGHITSFNSAIDIGCNQGAHSKIISDFGFRYVLGVDIDAAMIQGDNECFGRADDGKCIEFKVLSGEDVIAVEQYDFILCTEVIEHCSNPQKVVNNIKAALAPGGVVVITLPNLVSLPYIWVLLTHKLRRKPLDPVMRQHLSYPFWRSYWLFRDKRLRVIKTAGSNLTLTYSSVRYIYGKRYFEALNKVEFCLARLWPLKYFAQAFFLVIKKASAAV